jgi:SAM-dependent methyltransferase
MTGFQEQSATSARKAATAARMYDYFLGGIHNFVADREAAEALIAQFPFIRDVARSNRAFVATAVRHLARSGVRQFLDLGSGIPTVDNVHEIAREIQPDARVVYVDLDPVAVAEGMEILENDDLAVAVRGDIREPRAVLEHPDVRRTLNFDEPVGLLLAAVLHFVPDHEAADAVTAELIAAVAPGSHLVVSHSATETFVDDVKTTPSEDVYERRTATPGTTRTRQEVERLFAGLEILDPGVVWAQHWRPGPAAADEPRAAPGGVWAGVGRKP